MCDFSFFSGLILDIIIVAICKAYFRRRRPLSNKDDALGQMGPDVYSFPSGHCSRAVLVFYFFTRLWPVPLIFVPPMLAWVSAICISRLLMHRHYLLDIIGGIFLGLIEGGLMDILWLSDSSAKFLMSFLSDEKIDGGDYHVWFWFPSSHLNNSFYLLTFAEILFFIIKYWY